MQRSDLIEFIASEITKNMEDKKEATAYKDRIIKDFKSRSNDDLINLACEYTDLLKQEVLELYR